jgi:hypothetical protein
MSTESPFIGDGCQTVANADLSAKQYYAVAMTTTPRKVDLIASAIGIYGILMNKPKAGEVCDVAIFGIVPAMCGAAVTAGDPLAIDSTSRVITYASGVKIGIALESSTTAGQLIAIKIVPVPG